MGCIVKHCEKNEMEAILFCGLGARERLPQNPKALPHATDPNKHKCEVQVSRL